MGVAGRLAFLFVVVPVVELAILVRIGQAIGLWPTVALVLGTGALGAALARREGMRVLFAFRQELAAGRLPAQALLDGVSVLIGAALLLAPGVLTDLVGLGLLFAPSRRWIQRRARRRLERAVVEGEIRLATFGSGWAGTWGAPRSGGPWGSTLDPDAPRKLDSSNEIVIEPDDS